MNDVFSGGFTMQAEVNSIAEIQVLSGTFNAEYGEAMSGVVNQVTKIAGESLTGEVSAYVGDYMTNRTELFAYRLTREVPRVSSRPLLERHQCPGEPERPHPGHRRHPEVLRLRPVSDDDGYIYGKRMFNPSDSSNFSANDSADWYIGATGDGANVPMNDCRRWTLQGKLQIAVGSGKGIRLNGLYQTNDYRTYDHPFRLNPDGDYLRHLKSYLLSASYTHVFDDVDVPGRHGVGLRERLSSNTWIPTRSAGSPYVKPERMRDAGANAFLTGGTQNWHFYHKTNHVTGRVDLTAQVTPVHQIKGGDEVKLAQLEYEDFQIHVDAASGFMPLSPARGSFDYNIYTNHPYQLSGIPPGQDRAGVSCRQRRRSGSTTSSPTACPAGSRQHCRP